MFPPEFAWNRSVQELALVEVIVVVKCCSDYILTREIGTVNSIEKNRIREKGCNNDCN
jgi:hypothetical protein